MTDEVRYFSRRALQQALGGAMPARADAKAERFPVIFHHLESDGAGGVRCEVAINDRGATTTVTVPTPEFNQLPRIALPMEAA